ncbi:hypothetical protein SSPIM334S_04455 [Streptomyces spiroverticillatus]|nr:hypothetical protein [Streptomyces finlayi]
MAHLVFDPDEQRQLRAAARTELAGSPTLAYVLEHLAAEGIDLDECRDWEDLRAAKGLAPRDEDTAGATDVA